MKSGVFLDLGVSDHLLIYHTRKCKISPVNQHNSVKLRSLKYYTKKAFEAKLQEVDWQEVSGIDSVHKVFIFFNIYFWPLLTASPH